MTTQQYTNGTGTQVENVIIIGSGPAGFTAGLYAARANLNPLLITGNEYGGQVSLTYEIENYPGFPESLSGPELVEKMKAQAEKFGTRVEFDYVTQIDTEQYPFVVHTESGTNYATKSVILATGARPRYLEIPGEHELTGKGVSYCATCDGFFFRGKDVLVIGGGDSAAEEAIFLTKFASRVRLIHRRDELRASKILQQRVFDNPKIEIVWNTVLTDIEGEAGQVTQVKTLNTVTGEAGVLTTDGVFIFVGHLPNNQLLQGKFQLDEDGHLITDKFMHTNVPGIFAAGEIMDKVYKQVATSVGQGCAAAMQATKFLEEYEHSVPDLSVDPRQFGVAAVMQAETLGTW